MLHTDAKGTLYVSMRHSWTCQSGFGIREHRGRQLVCLCIIIALQFEVKLAILNAAASQIQVSNVFDCSFNEALSRQLFSCTLLKTSMNIGMFSQTENPDASPQTTNVAATVDPRGAICGWDQLSPRPASSCLSLIRSPLQRPPVECDKSRDLDCSIPPFSLSLSCTDCGIQL